MDHGIRFPNEIGSVGGSYRILFACASRAHASAEVGRDF